MADSLETLFATHVVEVVARRRLPPKMGQTFTRRFLCTNSYPLLNSIVGKSAFHFKAPTHPPPYNARSKNLITVFDLIMQDYRNINLNEYKILGAMPVRNEEEINAFWQQFFVPILSKYNASRKKTFMNM
jgi:hypothetical protein